MPDDPLHEFRQLDELDELRQINRGLERKLAHAKQKSADLVEAVKQGARDAALIQGPPPPIPQPDRDRRRRPEVAVLHLSDLHFGKRTESFNTQVAAERVSLLARKVAKIAEIERAAHPVHDLHILLGGDLIEGISIFPGQAHEVDSATFAQVFAAVTALEGLIRHMLSTFERVTVDEVTGNHGRLGRKGDHPHADNLDRLVGALLRERFRDETRLSWRDPVGGWYAIVEAGAWRALLIHGDQIKSFGGNVPAFGIARKVNAWASGVLGQTFTDVHLGHFHQPLVIPLANGQGRAYVNSSIESDSAYAQEFVAATGTPGQRLNFVDPKRGRVTTERILWLDS